MPDPSGCTAIFRHVVITMIALVLLSQPLLSAEGEARFADVKKILVILGFDKGIYDPVRAMDMQMDPSVEGEIGRIEGDAAPDTVEEFITIVYYSRGLPGSRASGPLDAELPRDKTGALRLCSMWLFKIAECPAGAERYRRAVRMVRTRSKLENSEIIDFFQGAVKRKVNETPIPELSQAEAEKLKDLLQLYLMSPVDPAHAENLRKYINVFGGPVSKKGGAIRSYLKGISPLIASKMS